MQFLKPNTDVKRLYLDGKLVITLSYNQLTFLKSVKEFIDMSPKIAPYCRIGFQENKMYFLIETEHKEGCFSINYGNTPPYPVYAYASRLREHLGDLKDSKRVRFQLIPTDKSNCYEMVILDHTPCTIKPNKK